MTSPGRTPVRLAIGFRTTSSVTILLLLGKLKDLKHQEIEEDKKKKKKKKERERGRDRKLKQSWLPAF